MNAVANYWKHHDEWPERVDQARSIEFGETPVPHWDTSKVNKGEQKTIELVTAIGMWPNRSINMQVAADALGIAELWDLSPLRKNLDDWARCLLTGHWRKQAAETRHFRGLFHFFCQAL